MADIRSLISQIPMEPGYVPAPPEPDLSVIQRLMGLPQTLRAVGQNLAVGAASLPVGIYRGFGDPAAGEAAMSQFQQEYGYTPTNPAAQRQLQGLGEFLQQLETEYKIPPIMAPVAATPALGIRGLTPQGQTLARDLVRDIQTTPPTGAVTMAPTPSVPKSDIGFYSQLEAAVQPLQNKGTGQQYLAQIQKSAGVKPEEIQWTGLDTFLQGRQSVTKQEIQDYLNANRVDVQEVRLGGATNPYPYRSADEWQGAIDRAEAANNWDEVDRLNQAWEAAEGYGPAGMTKFSQYTLPGGENYREILLTLPIQAKGANRYEVRPRKTPGESAVFDTEANKVIMFGRDAGMYQEADRLNRELAGTQLFRSSHFDQPNILAHLRVNDRTVDGKKTLFVEEIQSDWHQAGRKKGYQSKDIESQLKVSEERMAKRGQEIRQLSNRMAALDDTQLDEFNALAAERQRLQDLQGEEIDLGNRLYDARREGVPDAPFKTSWHELSLKRAIQEAAEKGYDQIAFTTGKTQAERYDLSKQVDYIDYVREGPDQFRLAIVGKNGQGIDLPKETFTAAELENYVGKEVAQRIAKGEGEVGGGRTTLRGPDLQVGGEGMKGFYDNILPKSLDKLGKKFGAKVGKTEMDGVEVWQMDITPQMRESVTTKGQPLFAIPAIGAGLLGAGMMQEEEQF